MVPVVRVVVPLRRVLSLAQEPRLVRVVLQDQMNVTVRSDFASHSFRKLQKHVLRRGVMDCMHRIEAKAIEAVFGEPVKRVVDEVFAHPAAALAAEVDGGAPGRLVLIGEELRRVKAEVVPLRAKVVVDDIQEHHEARRVRGIDEALERLRTAVAAVGRIGKHPVVAPVALAAEVRERHKLDRADAELA